MRVHASKVVQSETSQDLAQVLEAIRVQDGLRDRIRVIGGKELRVEAIERRDTDSEGNPEELWLLDFIRIRTEAGPGRVGRDSEVEGFDFEAEEGFGEESAALFIPATNHILTQYNHFGVRAGAMADYLSAYQNTPDNLYTFKPKFDQDVERRLTQQGITRSVSFTLDTTHMTEQDRQRGRALSEAIAYGREVGADRISVQISVQGERARGLLAAARETIAGLKGIMGQNPDAVTRLEVAGKADRDSVVEVLDLIGQRLSLDFDDLQVGEDLRYSRVDRWNALLRARSAWRRILAP